jgi:hypothetical protein
MEKRLEIQRQKGGGDDFAEEGNREKLIQVFLKTVGTCRAVFVLKNDGFGGRVL